MRQVSFPFPNSARTIWSRRRIQKSGSRQKRREKDENQFFTTEAQRHSEERSFAFPPLCLCASVVIQAMETLEQIKTKIEAAVPGARLEIIPNASGANQPSLLVCNEHAFAVAKFLRDDSQFQFDYASNVTGIDWLGGVTKEKVIPILS